MQSESDGFGSDGMESSKLLPLSHGDSLKSCHQQALAAWLSGSINADRVLESLYHYYTGHGYQALMLARTSNLMLLAFMYGFSIFLWYGVDWQFLDIPATAESHPRLWQVASLPVARMGILGWIATISFTAAWTWWGLVQLWFVDRPRWRTAQLIYRHLLGIRDRKLDRLDFDLVIKKLCALNEQHRIVPGKLDALQICARLMRRENYLIALFNRRLLDDYPVHLGSLGQASVSLCKPLEWALTFSILGYVFDENLMVQRCFLAPRRRAESELVDGLKRRFVLVGMLSAFLAPLVFLMTLVYLVFRYGEEAYRNPKSIAARQYTITARWRFREFNELPHYFDHRLSLSMRKATKYIEQFWSVRMVNLARLISFISGSIVLVLLAISVKNEDLLMHFELTPGKSVIWYLGLFGAILGISRGIQPDNSQRQDPATLLAHVIKHTHYQPKSWHRSGLGSRRCHSDFNRLYRFKLYCLASDLLGTLTTPFILMFRLTERAEPIIDFFREFTVHVDGLGYVCSFSLFDFRHAHPRFHEHAGQESPVSVAQTHETTHSSQNTETSFINKQASKQAKMEKSLVSFSSRHPDWVPQDPSSSAFLSRLPLTQARIVEDDDEKPDEDGLVISEAVNRADMNVSLLERFYG